MTLAYLDCFSGVAGDMWVGALLDLGLPFAELQGAVSSLGLPVQLRASKVRRASLVGTHFQVEVGEESSHRHLADIVAILDVADLPESVATRCRRVFEVLAEAESKVHGIEVAAVHFHEVGAADTIVDVVAAVLGCHLLGIDRIYSSAVVTGRGTVDCAHGTLPVPAPGTIGNLLGVPLRSGGPVGECVTPTGAALLRVMVDEYEPRVRYTPTAVGYGAGTRDDPEHPNLLRITLGEPAANGRESGALVEVSCSLDTVTGEALAYLIDGSLTRGAVDAFACAVTMKKGRPGHQFTALVDDAHREGLVRFLLEESSSLGVRIHQVEREVLERREEVRETEFGPVRFKVARLPSGSVLSRPEDDEVRRLVDERGISRREVLDRLQRPSPPRD